MRLLRTTRAILMIAALSTTAGAQSGTASVDTRNNLFLAGGNTGSFAGGGGLVPSAILLDAGIGRVLTISSTSGSAAFCAGGTCVGTPEGGSIGGTDVGSVGQIAGIVTPSPASGFLAGLFLDASLPAGAPSRLDFSGGLDFTTLTPQPGQIFFIGNGLTSGSVVQQFVVPTTATRLYFGIADGFGFSGAPGFYDDNVGVYNVSYAVRAQSTVPEPATVVLLAAGLLATAVVRRRRRA